MWRQLGTVAIQNNISYILVLLIYVATYYVYDQVSGI